MNVKPMHIKTVTAIFFIITATRIAAVFICSEFEERTFGISLSCGVSRRNIFIAKVIVFLIGMFSLLIVWTVAMVTVNSFVNGFGKVSYTDVILQISYGLAGYAAQGAFWIHHKTNLFQMYVPQIHYI